MHHPIVAVKKYFESHKEPRQPVDVVPSSLSREIITTLKPANPFKVPTEQGVVKKPLWDGASIILEFDNTTFQTVKKPEKSYKNEHLKRLREKQKDPSSLPLTIQTSPYLSACLFDLASTSVTKKESLGAASILKYCRTLTAIVRNAHEAGFVHCDIKLENILVRNDGTLTLIDWDFAKKMHGKDEYGDFAVAVLKGTPAYMPYEIAGILISRSKNHKIFPLFETVKHEIPHDFMPLLPGDQTIFRPSQDIYAIGIVCALISKHYWSVLTPHLKRKK